MKHGYWGKILRVDLTYRQIEIEEPEDCFYRTYLGGRNFGAYYLLKESPSNVNPLSPENVLVFCTSVITGTPIMGLAKFSVVAKSPLTGGYGEAEAGGFWGPELKFAGFDAVLIKGRSTEPVYLWIHDGEAELRSASHLWGKNTPDTQQMIQQELGDSKIRVAQIGPAGENLVRFSCIMSDLIHANGRAGMGAVMGSKNLKAIAVRGTQRRISLYDSEAVHQMARLITQEYKDSKYVLSGLHLLGTSASVSSLNASGMLPTRNFQEGVFEGAEMISGERMKETLVVGQKGCFACPVGCKKTIRLKDFDEPNSRFGGPEYETIGMLGSNCGIDDLSAVAKGGELCNRYGLDTISTGGMIAWTMECFEKGIITDKNTQGFKVRFGSAEVMLHLIEIIAHRQGIGDILADGVQRTVEEFGEESRKLCMQVKGQLLPAHDPRGKVGVGISYAVAPQGADHITAEHDIFFGTDSEFLKQLYPLGILGPVSPQDLSAKKIRLYVYLQQISSLDNILGVCLFAGAPTGPIRLKRLVDIVEAVTGWETSVWELMKAGERGINLARCFNMREGLTRKDDILPDRLFKSLPKGSLKDFTISRKEFNQALTTYYEMMGWDARTGIPKKAKLQELNIAGVMKERGK